MTTTTRRIGVTLAVIALAAGGGLASCDYLEDPQAQERPSIPTSKDPQPTHDSPSDSAAAGSSNSEAAGSLYNDLNMNETQARETLEVLPVERAHSMSGYSRDEFPHWLSAENWGWGNLPEASGCDAREATLVRDGTNVVPAANDCSAESGTWVDPYTGEQVEDSSAAEIDHMVPLAAAWRAGADGWTTDQRTIFANAPLSVVSTGPSNSEKGDKGPEVWKPENQEAWCPYSLRWVAVKNEFGLNLTSEDERAALEEMLDTCAEGSA